MPLYVAVTKDTCFKNRDDHVTPFWKSILSESTCNTILIRNSSNYRNYVDFRRSTSDGHPMPTGTCLFPTCCCSIMFRLVCCFGYSWCVSRLLRHGPGPDWSRPTKDVSNLHVCTRYEFFQEHINKKNNNMCVFDKMFVWVEIVCTGGTLNTLPRVSIWMFFLGSNPGLKVTKNKV